MTHSLTRKGQHSSRRFFERHRRKSTKECAQVFVSRRLRVRLQFKCTLECGCSADLFLSRHCPSLLVQRNYAVVFFCATTKKEAQRARRARCLSRTVIAAKLRCTT